MFIFYANKNLLTVHQKEPITSGSSNTYRVQFEFSPDWEGLIRTACFRSGGQTISVLLDETGRCVVPWEVTRPGDSGKRLFAGVCGSDISGTVLPTIWADCGVIQPGASGESAAKPPTPGPLETVMESKADGLSLDGRALRLLSGDRELATITLPDGPSGELVATEEDVSQMLGDVFTH